MELLEGFIRSLDGKSSGVKEMTWSGKDEGRRENLQRGLFRGRFARFLFHNLLVGIAFALSLPVWAQPGGQAVNRILVQPRVGLSPRDFGEALRAHGVRSSRAIPQINLHLVELPADADRAAVARALSRDPRVQFAEPDELIPPADTIANDPRFGSEWHLAKIGSPGAWDYALGDGVTVAILDTGVDAGHPDLAGQLRPGWNIYDNSSDTSDVYGHGTKVAGVVAAASNNGLGVTAIAWHSRIMPVRISRADGYAYFSTIAEGLTWAADHGARVANISYAVSGSASVRGAADYLKSLGGLVVVSAGNSGVYEYYGASSSMISVAATDSADGRASWSSFGEFVDLAAPGVGIWTTTNGGGYSSPSGTSFSSPVTAAVVALMMSANPALSPGELESILMESAVDLGAEGYDIYFGHGRVDAQAAVLGALGSSGRDTRAPSVSVISPVGGATVSGFVSVDVGASDDVGVSRVDLYLDGGLLGSDTSAPYQFSWDTSSHADGAARLEAFAQDAAGNTGASSPIDVIVDNFVEPPDSQPPTVAILNPNDGESVNGTVSVAVSAADDNALHSTTLYVDGVPRASSSNGFTYSWNTRRESLGAHSLTATAEDSAGNRATATVSVSVTNAKKGKP